MKHASRTRRAPRWPFRAAALLLALVLLPPRVAVAVPPQSGYQGNASDSRAIISGVFGEPTLDDVIAIADAGGQGDAPPWRQFRRARDAAAEGDAAAAAAALDAVLALGETGDAVALWAWANLRRLGRSPPAAIADQVRGVVWEAPGAGRTEYLSAYADGRWRIVDAAGGGIFWEKPNDPASREITDAIIAAGQRLTYWTPDPAPRETAPPAGVRITLLTFAGPRQTPLAPTASGGAVVPAELADSLIEGFARLRRHADRVAGSAR